MAGDDGEEEESREEGARVTDTRKIRRKRSGGALLLEFASFRSLCSTLSMCVLSLLCVL